MAEDKIKQELWVAWTHDAISVYEEPDDINAEDVVDDMVDFSVDYADAMLEEFAHKFASGKARRRRGKAKGRGRSKLDPDDDDDDDDDP
jgi:hypothetical protein